ncbi:hypothetical protein HanPSC8_Chr01g0038621 [Helianthus annuus]|nr:hypothetical protein HanPSC8_Chr01g0038621 [Helianthus annuus]
MNCGDIGVDDSEAVLEIEGRYNCETQSLPLDVSTGVNVNGCISAPSQRVSGSTDEDTLWIKLNDQICPEELISRKIL